MESYIHRERLSIGAVLFPKKRLGQNFLNSRISLSIGEIKAERSFQFQKPRPDDFVLILIDLARDIYA